MVKIQEGCNQQSDDKSLSMLKTLNVVGQINYNKYKNNNDVKKIKESDQISNYTMYHRI